MKNSKMKCPICKGKSKEKRLKQFVLLKCTSCGLEWQKKMPTDSELDSIYSEYSQSKFDYDRYDFFNAVYKKYISKLKKASVLDLGCGLGHFLDILKGKGWDIEGIDMSKSSVKIAKKKLGNKIHLKSIESFKTSKKYDLILMIDIIEHVRNPDHIMQKVKDLLKKDGLLIMNTPNTSAILAKISGKTWFQYKREHLYYFNSSNIKQFLSKNGFKTIKCDPTIRNISFYLVRNYLIYYPKKVIPKIADFFYKIFGEKLSKKIKIKIPASEIIVIAKRIENIKKKMVWE